jgi:hypothetical protein
MNVNEIPRKVIVYGKYLYITLVGETKYEKSWWEDYVKPYFDRAALDYEVKSGSSLSIVLKY